MNGMYLDEILAEYDAMFGKNTLEEIEQFLVEQIAGAKNRNEHGILVTLLNEIIGFCRDTTQKEKALHYCDALLALLEAMQLQGSVAYATSLLNIANAYRAFGLFEQSMGFYETVLEIYQKSLTSNDFNYASLYNNWSLLYQEMQEYENAVKMLKKALQIVDSYESALIPQATTRTNLAATLLQIRTEDAYVEAMQYLQEALAVFETDGGRDFHYGAALVAMGDANSYKCNFAEAAKYYAKGLEEIEKHTGRNDNYTRVLEKYQRAKVLAAREGMEEADVSENGNVSEDVWQSNLERCQAFYNQYGKQMIQENFPKYADRIAVGMVGEGSDCFGFDDEISADHDYGVGFCMWMTESDYPVIGDKLQATYEALVEKVSSVGKADRFLKGRRGVFTINEFYGRLLGVRVDYESGELNELGNCHKLLGLVEEFRLAQAVNGAVFEDVLGTFSSVREKLKEYYPEDIWRNRMAQAMYDFSQYAQSNYARMMARGDMLTAQICIGRACEAAMDLTYLVEQQYAPYYKWKRIGLGQIARRPGSMIAEKVLKLLQEIAETPVQNVAWDGVTYSSTEINSKDRYVVLFEELAAVLLEGLKLCGAVKPIQISGSANSVDVFLENYVMQVLSEKKTSANKGEKGGCEVNMEIIEKIVELEWKQFDKVKNEGGRADCQDNWGTFSIMRKSQYLAWNEELLKSFYNDLLQAETKGWNLIMEKYARMMKSTVPERYAELEKDLPVLSEDRIAIQEEIIKIQVAWMEDFASKYPKMAGNARSIHTEEDNAYNTSYETYLRGEISTYSENTFVLYGRFVAGLLREGRNLAYEIMRNTAELYGYESVEDAESRLE